MIVPKNMSYVHHLIESCVSKNYVFVMEMIPEPGTDI